jgi:simple sugar transport system substrate-binding protein
MIVTRRTTLAALAATAVLALAGCGKKEAEKPAETAAPASAPAAAAAEPLKVAFVYIGPVGDAGWTYAHDAGRKAVEAKFGDKVKTTFVENVPESAADAERVFRDLASQGNKLIFGTTFGYMESMLKVAKDSRTSSSSTPPASRPPTTWRSTTCAPMRARTWLAWWPAR